MSWIDSLYDWINELFDSNKSTKVNNEDKNNAKVVLTLDEAKAKLEELKNTPHLTKLKKPSLAYYSGECDCLCAGYNEDNMLNYTMLPNHYDLYDAKSIFEDKKILYHDVEIDKLTTFSCDKTITNEEKNYIVKTFDGWANNSLRDSSKKLRVVYYGDIKKYALIVTHGYYRNYISDTYDNLQTLQQEVLMLANIIRLEKEIKVMEAKEKAKRLEETAWS